MALMGVVSAFNMARGYFIAYTVPYGTAAEAAETALVLLSGTISSPGSGASFLISSYARY
jgi:hypothetical protein